MSVSDLERGREKDITTVPLYLDALGLTSEQKLVMGAAAEMSWKASAKEDEMTDQKELARHMSTMCNSCGHPEVDHTEADGGESRCPHCDCPEYEAPLASPVASAK